MFVPQTACFAIGRGCAALGWAAGHWGRLLLWGIAILFVGFFLLDLPPPPGPKNWLKLCTTQVFEGPDEVWLFASVDRCTRRARFASPSVVHVVERQYVVVLNEDAIKNVFTLSGEPAFNENVSTIFRFGECFFVLQPGSAYSPRTFFQWTNDAFREIPATEADKILTSAGLIVPTCDLDERAREVTRQAGWDLVYSDTFSFGDMRLTFQEKGLTLWMDANDEQQTIYASLDRGGSERIRLVHIESRRGGS